MIYKMLQYVLLFLVLAVVIISVLQGIAWGFVPAIILLGIARAKRPETTE